VTTFAVLLVVSLCFTALTVRAMRRSMLREQIAILWIVVSVLMVGISLTFPFHLLDHLARAIGIKYGSDLVFFAALVFMVVLAFQMSVTITRLNARTTRLAQELALLTARRRTGRDQDDSGEAARGGDGPPQPSGPADQGLGQ
jgi:hypothetical protein